MAKKGLVKKIGTSLLAGTMLLGSSLAGLERKVHAQEQLPAEYSLAHWMTPIQNQGIYSLCFDFAAIAAIESKLKMANGNPNYNPNLSEQQYPCYDPRGYTQGGSSGAVLAYARDVGIVEEKTLPFVGPSSSCQIPANARRYFVKSYESFNPASNAKSVEEIRNNAKAYLIEKGPLVVGMTLGGSKDVNGIYKCNGNTGSPHFVVIYGYKETGDIHTSYWQVKDSMNQIDKIGMDWYIPKFGYTDQCKITMSPQTSVEVFPANHIGNAIKTMKVLTGNPVEDFNRDELDCNQNGVIDPADAVCSLQKAAELR